MAKAWSTAFGSHGNRSFDASRFREVKLARRVLFQITVGSLNGSRRSIRNHFPRIADVFTAPPSDDLTC
ncbi:hypothetical protein UG54_01615 [Gordonia sihwensis]|nr:hypothetical protein UG54_01615 [Gordonia sihwensis]